MARRDRLVDLSHAFTDGTVTYPGLPAPSITPHLTREASRSVYAEGTEFEIDSITMVGNTGTYLDSPFHRYAEGTDLAGLELDSLVDLPTIVVRSSGAGGRGIDVSCLDGLEVRGCAVLFDTGWDRHFATPQYGIDAPYLTAAVADYCVEHGVLLVGIDSVNIDDTQGGGVRPVHSTLLEHGIHVVEHLANLAALPDAGALFTAVPPKVAGFGTFPVRAFAKVPGPHETTSPPDRDLRQ